MVGRSVFTYKGITFKEMSVLIWANYFGVINRFWEVFKLACKD
jgi:hypothetical protein